MRKRKSEGSDPSTPDGEHKRNPKKPSAAVKEASNGTNRRTTKNTFYRVALATVAVLLTTLAVTATSDLIKLSTHPASDSTSPTHSTDPAAQPIVLLPGTELLVIWDILCLQLLHIPPTWLAAFGCTVFPHTQRSSLPAQPSAAAPHSSHDTAATLDHLETLMDTVTAQTRTSETSTTTTPIPASPAGGGGATTAALKWTFSVETLVSHMTGSIPVTAEDKGKPSSSIQEIQETRVNIPDDADTTAVVESAVPCVFCGISDNASERSRLVYEDEKYVAFHDINPSARIHILVVPRRHVENILSLSVRDLSMVREMKAIAHLVLSRDFHVPIKDHHLGFHVPPFTSVPHLHLHGIGRPFKNWVRAAKYPEAKNWWLSAGSSLSHSVFGKGRWIRWWVEVNDFIGSLEAAEERGDFRKFSWDFFGF
ncbi:hypothetical protein HDU77_006876 [Chytriomyces hyalinus]|nr:hypothetical protein HDU77_006876 [Chytriomyces hyalinus]